MGKLPVWSRLALIVLLFLALAAFACRGEESVSAAREAASGATPPPAPDAASPRIEGLPAATGSGTPVDNQLGLFAPALPGIGLDTHSTECDPFGTDSEVCF